MKRIMPFLAVAAVGGAIAILLPGVIALEASVGSLFRDVVQQPSVWAFQGLFVVGFVLALIGKLEWIDLPLTAVAMIAFFPFKAALELATGAALIAWPQEFYLYGAWLIPALVGLATGKTMRAAYQRSTEKQARPGPKKRRSKRRKR
jgi:hypothetical protein